jgi:FAD:protein FMN transferase
LNSISPAYHPDVEKITLARNAMATRFEFVLLGSDPVRLRAAGEEALNEIERVESQLSLYRPGSEIATINARAAFERVPVSPEVFALILQARRYWEISGGSFDITIAPLVRCWGFMKGNGSPPTEAQLATARECVGMNLLEVDEERSTIHFQRPGMMLDLGSIGKGYALDLAMEILRDAGVENALLHGGTSTIYALGEDVNGRWKVAVEKPALPTATGSPNSPAEPLAIVDLSNESLSVSAVWGKFFTLEGKTYGHVIDPRTGWPTQNALLGAVVAGSATESDALSTAVLLGNENDLDALRERSGARFLQASTKEGVLACAASGIGILKIGT